MAASLRSGKAPRSWVNRVRPKDFSRREIEFDSLDIWQEEKDDWIRRILQGSWNRGNWTEETVGMMNQLGDWIFATTHPGIAHARKKWRYCLPTRRGLRFTNKRPLPMVPYLFLGAKRENAKEK
jgi:hypothetical protein